MENSGCEGMRPHINARTETLETVDGAPCYFAVLHNHGLMGLVVCVRQGFRRSLSLNLRMEPSIAVQFPFL
jgi:hypothetical protein